MSTFSARFVELDALLARRDEWQVLMDAALEPNPFYGPDYLAAAQHHIHPLRPIHCLIVEKGAQLVGLLPLEKPIISGLLFGRAWRLYRNPYTCLGTPLLDRTCAAEALNIALAALREARGPKRLILQQIPSDSAFAELLATSASAHGLALARLFLSHRALVETTLTPEVYAARYWPASRRKSMRRKQRALEALGQVSVQTIPAGSASYPTALGRFLELEAGGWKGDAGTALAASRTTRAFAHEAFNAPGTMIEALMLDDRAIAMALMLTSQHTGYTVKVAFDEEFARFSPGTLLDAAMIALAGPGGDFKRLDSCALPGHPVEQIWAERGAVADIVLGLVPQRSSFGIRLLTGWMNLVERVRMLRHRRSYTTRPAA